MQKLLHTLLLVGYVQSQSVYDVVVYGSNPAGIAAAISAARGGARVALLEPTSYLGGMAVAGGIGFRDLGVNGTLGGIGWEWIQLNSQHYGVSSPVYQPDMDVGKDNFIKLLNAAAVHLVYNSPLRESTSVKKSGTKILSIFTQNSTGTLEWQAKVFVDASYEGDLARFAGASYTYGREARSQYLEEFAGVRPTFNPWGNFLADFPTPATYPNGTLFPYIKPGPIAAEGSADKNLQGFSYRLCITDNQTNQVPFPRPPKYNTTDFSLLQAFLKTVVDSKTYPDGPPFDYMVQVLDYYGYPNKNKWDMCDGLGSGFTSDAIDQAAGYVEGTYAERQAVIDKHYYYVAGFLTFLATDQSVPSATRKSVNRYGLCKDQWVENNHWPPQLYVREALRIIGDSVFTQQDLVPSTKLRRNDTIGLGSWGVDIHVVQRIAVEGKDGSLIADNEGQMWVGVTGNISRDDKVTDGPQTFPYELPYYLLLPKREELTNLLVPVCSSSSHVAFNSLRVEPTYVQLGQAAGNAAFLAAKNNVSVQDVSIPQLQTILLAQGVKLHWNSSW